MKKQKILISLLVIGVASYILYQQLNKKKISDQITDLKEEEVEKGKIPSLATNPYVG